jgi:hypothetical protein
MSPASLSQYADTLRRADPEDFGHLPLYLVDRADVPDLAWPGDAGGFTSEFLDVDLQPHLTAISAWAGRGYAMCLDLPQFPDPDSVLAIVIHEAAHWLLQPEPTEAYLDSLADLCRAVGWREDVEPMWSFFKSHGDAPPVGPPPPPWDNHDSAFVRGALHLRYRLQPMLPLAVAGDRYGLSPLFAYYFRLSDELLAHPTGSIRSILATPEPAEFAALFLADITG